MTVELSRRETLVRIVEEEGITIKEASSRLQINYSTAKHIVK
jgi:transposase